MCIYIYIYIYTGTWHVMINYISLSSFPTSLSCLLRSGGRAVKENCPDCQHKEEVIIRVPVQPRTYKDPDDYADWSGLQKTLETAPCPDASSSYDGADIDLTGSHPAAEIPENCPEGEKKICNGSEILLSESLPKPPNAETSPSVVSPVQHTEAEASPSMVSKPPANDSA